MASIDLDQLIGASSSDRTVPILVHQSTPKLSPEEFTVGHELIQDGSTLDQATQQVAGLKRVTKITSDPDSGVARPVSFKTLPEDHPMTNAIKIEPLPGNP